ncbi:MAG TPA: hypothetical protein DCS93_05925 [Microscillaceae bacterium]|nr:hypothetical protein [Microscillaceae bacterium]
MRHTLHYLLLFALSTIVACTHPIYSKIGPAVEQQGFAVIPDPLKRSGQEVTFTMSVTVAKPLLPMSLVLDTEYIFQIVYVPGDASEFIKGMMPKQEIKVGSFSFKAKDYQESKKAPVQIKKMRFAYEEKHRKGYLIYYLFIHQGYLHKRIGPYLVTHNGKPVTGIE